MTPVSRIAVNGLQTATEMSGLNRPEGFLEWTA
jgi:hypothetical protein